MHLFRLPDELYIQRIRKSHRRRIFTGILLLLSALIFYLAFKHLLLAHFKMGIHMDQMGIWNQVPLFTPDDPQLIQRNMFVFSYGCMAGIAFKTLYLSTTIMVISGIALIFTPDRKTRLLLQLWDQKQAVSHNKLIYDQDHDTAGLIMQYISATIDDAMVLAQLNQQLIRDEKHRNPMDITQLQNRMTHWLETEYQAVIFQLDQQVVGYVLFRTDDKQTYIRQFFIDTRYRRQNLGRQAIKWLRINRWQNSQILRLDVLTGNTPAIDFWHAMGFEDYCVTMELHTPT